MVKEPETSAGWTAQVIDGAGTSYALSQYFFRIPKQVKLFDVDHIEVCGDIGGPEKHDYDFPDNITFVRLAAGDGLVLLPKSAFAS